MGDPLIIGVLGDYFRESVVIGLLGVIVVLRFRRYRAAGAAAVGAFSSAATVGVAVIVTLFGLVALGYWDPPISDIVGDALGAGRTVYDAIGEWLIEKFVGWLDDVAAE
jgi:hypothetical protein